MSLFLRMDTACARELSPDECDSLDPLVYLHILEICSRVAQSDEPAATDTIPRPPATQYIRVNLVIPGDFVWRCDLSFDVVDSTTIEDGEIVLVYIGGRTAIHDPSEHLRVAVSPDRAMQWNEERCCMGETTLRSVAEAYGVF